MFGWFRKKQRERRVPAQGFRLQLWQATRHGRRIRTEPDRFIHLDCAEGAKGTIEPRQGKFTKNCGGTDDFCGKTAVLALRLECLRNHGSLSIRSSSFLHGVASTQILHFCSLNRKKAVRLHLSERFPSSNFWTGILSGWRVIRSVAVNTSRLPAKASRRRKKKDESSNSSTPCRD